MDAGISLILAVVFGLFFYTFNTPLGPSVGSDNGIYLTMGTAIADGYAPYTEIFDHKGPLVFVLQAIPQLLAGGYSTLAVFAQQVLFLFACLYVIDALARQLHVRHTVLVQLAYLVLIAEHIGGGNLTEEYTNLFTLIGLYMVMRVFDAEAKPRKDSAYLLPAAMLGVMTMLCVLVRANNALPLCGVVAVLSAALLLEKRFKALGYCAAGMAVGCAAAALPVVLWLAWHGALSAAVYGAFIHNMMYAETAGASRVWMLLHSSYGHWALLMAALSCLGALVLFIRSKRIALPLAIAAGAAMGGLAAFISHKYYQHYLILSAPIAALGVALMLERLQRLVCCGRQKRAAIGLGVMLVLLLTMYGAKANTGRIQEVKAEGSFRQDARDLYALVPEEDHDSFMAYRVEPKWYVYTKALPCMRFYFLQEILADADPAVMDEIVAEFESDPPKWLVIYYNREFGPPYDARVAAIFENDYAFVDAKGQYQLLRLKEDGDA